MFRSSIVCIICKLVQTLRTESYQLHSIVIPILQESIDTTKPGHLYLLEEGLTLWLCTLQNSSVPSNALLALFPAAIGLLELGTESIKTVMHILEASVVLAPLETLQLYAEPLFRAVCSMMGSLTVNASNSLLRLVDMVLQSCNAVHQFKALLQVMFAQGLFIKLLGVILEGNELGPIVIGFLMVLSRMILYDASSVLQIIQTTGGDGAVGRVLDAYISKVFTVSSCSMTLLDMPSKGSYAVLHLPL